MIITISHQKGGVGKSTIAFNLAVELSRKYKDVKVIDLDVQQTLTQANIIRKNSGLRELKIKRLLDEDEFIENLKKAKDDEIVIVDSGGFDSALNRIAIVAADILITPVTDKTFDLLGLQKFEEILRELSQIEKRDIKSYVLLNNINPKIKKFDELKDFIENSKHFKILNSVIRSRVAFSNSVAEGKSVKEFKEDSKAAKEIEGFIEELLNLWYIKYIS